MAARSDEKPPNPVDGNERDVKEEDANESSEKPFFAMPQPMREEQIGNAVKFLSHPRVKGSPVIYRRSFLEKKGLTKEEIDEAFRRVPDPPSNVTNAETAAINQATQSTSSTVGQPQVATQTLQPTAVVTPMVPVLQRSRFNWSHAVLAIGVLAASGAGSAVLFKNMVIPRLKTWIRKVVEDKSETDKEEKVSPVLGETVAEAAKTAATAATIAVKASQELLNARNEERKSFEAFMSLIDVQVKETRSMGEAIRKLESTWEKSYSQGKLIEEYAQYKMGDGPTNYLRGPTKINYSDTGAPSTFSKQVKVNGTSDADFGKVVPSSTPASMEPAIPPHSKSYMEIMAMIQRGEKPPGIKEINDMPPNPDQPPSKSLLTPRLKPWEAYQQRPSNGLESQSSGEGWVSSRVEGSSTASASPFPNGRFHNAAAAEPWGKQKTLKITEMEPETEDPKKLSFTQRAWVPPQPPSVVMPEAAAAIRQPKKPSIEKQQSDEVKSGDGEGASEESIVEVERNGNGIGAMNQSEIREEQGADVY